MIEKVLFPAKVSIENAFLLCKNYKAIGRKSSISVQSHVLIQQMHYGDLIPLPTYSRVSIYHSLTSLILYSTYLGR